MLLALTKHCTYLDLRLPRGAFELRFLDANLPMVHKRTLSFSHDRLRQYSILGQCRSCFLLRWSFYSNETLWGRNALS